MWSTSNERRKYRKVIVERRRRERIDRCLEQLRVLVQQGLQTQSLHLNPDSSTSSSSTPVTKLEKADILELTVEYLRTITAQSSPSRATQGYIACLQEVDNFFSGVDISTASNGSNTATSAASSTSAADNMRRLRNELMARLSSRAVQAVGHHQSHLRVQPPEVIPVPSSSSSSSRRALADRNCRNLAPSVRATMATSASSYDDVNRAQLLSEKCRLERTASDCRCESSKINNTGLGLACYARSQSVTSPDLRRPSWLPEVARRRCFDEVACVTMKVEDLENFDAVAPSRRYVGWPLSSGCVEVVGESSSTKRSRGDVVESDADSSQFDVDSENDEVSSLEQSAMWRPW